MRGIIGNERELKEMKGNGWQGRKLQGTARKYRPASHLCFIRMTLFPQFRDSLGQCYSKRGRTM